MPPAIGTDCSGASDVAGSVDINGDGGCECGGRSRANVSTGPLSSGAVVAVNRCAKLPNGGCFSIIDDGDGVCAANGVFGSAICTLFAVEFDALRKFSAILSIFRMSAILLFLFRLSMFSKFFLLPFSSMFDDMAAALLSIVF